MALVSSARPAVIFISAVTGHGGPNASLRVLVPRLGDFEPTMVGPYDDDDESWWEERGVPVVTIPRARGFRLAIAAWGLLRLAYRTHARHPVLFANGLTEVVVALPVLLLTRSRCVVWIHDFEVPRPVRLLRGLLRHLSPRRLELLAVSSVASEIGAAVFERSSTIIPNPIEGGGHPHRRLRSEPGRLRVAYVAGTDRRYKGFDLLPQIIAATEGLPLDWLIVAHRYTQPDAWHALDEVSDRSRSQVVTVSDRRPDPGTFYEWADVVIVPSRQESFSRVAAEAMAFGCAVVAARLPALVEVCGDCATYFAVGDAAAAGRALAQLSQDRDGLALVAASGQERAERYSPVVVAEQVRAVLTHRY